MSKVIVVGSGLSGIAAIKSLIAKGIKPLVLDTGEVLEKKKLNLKNNLSELSKENWNINDLNELTKNHTINDRFPKKCRCG